MDLFGLAHLKVYVRLIRKTIKLRILRTKTEYCLDILCMQWQKIIKVIYG